MNLKFVSTFFCCYDLATAGEIIGWLGAVYQFVFVHFLIGRPFFEEYTLVYSGNLSIVPAPGSKGKFAN